jgi:transposase
MSHIQPNCRQQLMMPSIIDDYVSLENPVRFIDTFVDKIVQIQPELLTDKGNAEVGRSAYLFTTLLKLYIYGFLNSISSSRKLEKETYRNMEMMWLLGNLQPDHKTISDFRKDNKESIRKVTISFRKFLITEGYIGGKLVVTDGTKIKANASRNTVSLKGIAKRMEQLEVQLEKYLTQLQDNDTVESVEEQLSELSSEFDVEPALLEKIAKLQEQVQELEQQKQMLEKLGRESIAPADIEAKIMKSKEGFYPAYNAQSIVDTKHHMIALMDVTDEPNDYNSLESNLNALESQIGLTPDEALADKGYANEDQIQSLEESGIECIVPFPEKAPDQKQIDAGITFRYDKKNDCYHCSQGQTLPLKDKNMIKGNRPYNRYQGKNCNECPVKAVCTKSQFGRVVYRRLDNEWLLKYKDKLKTKEYKKKIKLRKNYVEHPFGTIKYWMGQIPLLLRGKQKVQVEIDLYSTCYNLKRLINLESMEVLLLKIQNWE